MGTKLFALFGILYLVWQLGRFYEHREIQKRFVSAFEHSYDTYFFPEPEVVDPVLNAVGDRFVAGPIDVGRCFDREGESFLIRYYPR